MNVAIIGSTGSIGTQALDVAAMHADRVRVVALAAGSNWERMLEQARRFGPRYVLMKDPAAYEQLRGRLPGGTELLGPDEGIEALAALDQVDTALVSVVGIAGLSAVLAALEAGKRVALANKEALVAGGALVRDALKRYGGELLPVDSEHCAIHQCLRAARADELKRIMLTASGGPFLGLSAQELERVTPQQALRHPTWAMGAKITIDSATLMNKGLEVIEAHWLFDVPEERIDVLVHPQSIVHSMVEFNDHSVVAQLGYPDMRLPIQYALLYPQRLPSCAKATDFTALAPLSFAAPDEERFPCLKLARQALRQGGGAPVVLNGANEVAVADFLAGRIGFMDIWRRVEYALERIQVLNAPTLDEIWQLDRRAREVARLEAF